MNRADRRRAQREGVPTRVVQFAETYRCGHCESVTAWPWRDPFGFWHVDALHDDSCPAARGRISHQPDVARAVRASGIDYAVVIPEEAETAR